MQPTQDVTAPLWHGWSRDELGDIYWRLQHKPSSVTDHERAVLDSHMSEPWFPKVKPWFDNYAQARSSAPYIRKAERLIGMPLYEAWAKGHYNGSRPEDIVKAYASNGVVHGATRRARPRRAAGSSSKGASNSDDGPEPPPRLCACGCGESLAGRPNKRYLDGSHKQREHRHRQLARSENVDLAFLRDVALGLVRRGEIAIEEAFVLSTFPTPRILEALEARRQQVAA